MGDDRSIGYKGKDQGPRDEAVYLRLGTRAPQCKYPGCTVTEWRMLTGDGPDDILCYEHRCLLQRRSTTERHHPAGRKNDPSVAVEIPGNTHRYLDECKRAWPAKTRTNPEGSPALQAAAYVRAAMDWLVLVIEWFLGRAAVFLERLDEALTSRHGRCWWETFELGELCAPGK